MYLLQLPESFAAFARGMVPASRVFPQKLAPDGETLSSFQALIATWVTSQACGVSPKPGDTPPPLLSQFLILAEEESEMRTSANHKRREGD
jgi:hypothetical protein